MFYFTTFIITLLLAHITRAVPACGDVASSEGMYHPMYDAEEILFSVTWDSKYDDPNGNTSSLPCDFILHSHFKDIPGFPYLGAAYDIRGKNSPNCGKCWKLTNPRTHKFVHFTAVDSAKHGFVLSKHAYKPLNGGNGTLEVEAEHVDERYCRILKVN